jgi:hypothetical protein
VGDRQMGQKKTWTNAVVAGLIAGFAIYVKLPASFLLPLQ